MDQTERAQKLVEISTMWTTLQQATEGSADTATPAQAVLVQRYYGAVYHYILGALRDPEAASELAQDFVLRFLQGRFRHANPKRGRFRDYLKTALIHMINDYHDMRRASPKPIPRDDLLKQDDDSIDADSNAGFIRAWRDELLDRTWSALAETKPLYHAALRFRVEHPEATSAQIAYAIGQESQTELTAAGIRKTLQRAHEKFARLLVDEVATSLGTDGARVEDELAELELLKYCRAALEIPAKGGE